MQPPQAGVCFTFCKQITSLTQANKRAYREKKKKKAKQQYTIFNPIDRDKFYFLPLLAEYWKVNKDYLSFYSINKEITYIRMFVPSFSFLGYSFIIRSFLNDNQTQTALSTQRSHNTSGEKPPLKKADWYMKPNLTHLKVNMNNKKLHCYMTMKPTNGNIFTYYHPWWVVQKWEAW